MLHGYFFPSETIAACFRYHITGQKPVCGLWGEDSKLHYKLGNIHNFFFFRFFFCLFYPLALLELQFVLLLDTVQHQFISWDIEENRGLVQKKGKTEKLREDAGKLSRYDEESALIPTKSMRA